MVNLEELEYKPFSTPHQKFYCVYSYTPLAGDVLEEANYDAIKNYLIKNNIPFEEIEQKSFTYRYFLVLVTPRADVALKIYEKLQNYPIFDEDLYYEYVALYASEFWNSLPLDERIELCKKANVSPFASRHDYETICYKYPDLASFINYIVECR